MPVHGQSGDVEVVQPSNFREAYKEQFLDRWGFIPQIHPT